MPKKRTGYMGFDPLKAKLARRPDVFSPGGLAAWIGRQKYGHARFQRAAARAQKLGNPNVLIHYISQALFTRAKKRAIQLAQSDADRSGRPVAIVDQHAGRVLQFIRPRKLAAGKNPRAALGRYRLRRQGGRQIVEVYRA